MRITDEAEYEAVKAVLAHVKEAERSLHTPEALSLMGDTRAQLQAAVDQYEAEMREEQGKGER